MTKYAEGTEVPASRSLDEIRNTLRRFGANDDGFGYAEKAGMVAIQFELQGSRYIMRLTLPQREDFKLDSRGYLRTETAIQRDIDKETRRVWRSLANVIKATMAAVQDGIVSSEQALSPYLMLPNGRGFWEEHGDNIKEAARGTASMADVFGLPAGKVIELPARSGS